MDPEKAINILSPKDMSKQTLQNAIIYLSKKQEHCTNYGLGEYEFRESNARTWIKILRDEWASRD